MSSENVDSESVTVGVSPDVEELKQLVRRLRPGDQVSYQTGRRDKDTDETIIRKDSRGTVTKVDEQDGCYRVFITGPQGGGYVIYPEKSEGMGGHVPPEMFHVSSDPNGGYTETTENSVISLSITAKREL